MQHSREVFVRPHSAWHGTATTKEQSENCKCGSMFVYLDIKFEVCSKMSCDGADRSGEGAAEDGGLPLLSAGWMREDVG